MRQTWGLNVTKSISESTYCQPFPGYGDAEAHLEDDYYSLTVVPSSAIPSMTLCRDSKEEDQFN